MKFYGLLMYVHCATIILLYQSKPEGNGMKDRIVRQFSSGGVIYHIILLFNYQSGNVSSMTLN